jgi:hypothetical protein
LSTKTPVGYRNLRERKRPGRVPGRSQRDVGGGGGGIAPISWIEVSRPARAPRLPRRGDSRAGGHAPESSSYEAF